LAGITVEGRGVIRQEVREEGGEEVLCIFFVVFIPVIW
jgi:hypothetical protein